ncbi:MAG TPA: S41 family peptidase [Allosphingosinicella sp.]|uniref:S41 family peptidase n=1 Tax=Allosphingosinicella sp. TaxID=2823234 RepID=UPI002EDA7485
MPVFTAALVAVALPAQTSAPQAGVAPTAQEATKIVESLAQALTERFVFPEAGERYARALRNGLVDGRYSRFSTSTEFAEALTQDLQRIHPDGHLRVIAPGTGSAQAGAGQGGATVALERGAWIAPGIAYLSFSLFPGDPATLAKLEDFLRTHSKARTLVIDVRTHAGGGLAEMDRMFPYFFSRPTSLLQMDTRRSVDDAGGGVFPDGPTVIRLDGPKEVVRREHVAVPAKESGGLSDAKIFVLTAARTASAAEHFALALKRTGRATLIGEVTAGAGHVSPRVDIGSGYAAQVPIGRTFDPTTGRGWEGAGIGPHIAVPAERALVEALIRSGVAAADAARLSAEFRPNGSMERRRPLRLTSPL